MFNRALVNSNPAPTRNHALSLANSQTPLTLLTLRLIQITRKGEGLKRRGEGIRRRGLIADWIKRRHVTGQMEGRFSKTKSGFGSDN